MRSAIPLLRLLGSHMEARSDELMVSMMAGTH